MSEYESKEVYWHPSGPGLKGQPHCPGGQIYDHTLKRCTSVFAATGKLKDRLKNMKERMG